MELYSGPRDWLARIECPVCRRPYRRLMLAVKGDEFPCASCGTHLVKRSEPWPVWLAAPWAVIAVIGCFTVLARFKAGMLYAALWLFALAVTFPHRIMLEKAAARELERDLMQYPIGRIVVFFSFGIVVVLVAFTLFRPLFLRVEAILE
jgi:hypothetical protein